MPKILKTKKQQKNQNKTVLCIISVLKGFAVFAIGFLLLSFLIYKANDNLFYYFAVLAVLALGTFIAGYISYKKIGGRGIVCGLISAVIILALLIVIVLFTMKFEVTARILLLIPVCLVSGISGGILSANK